MKPGQRVSTCLREAGIDFCFALMVCKCACVHIATSIEPVAFSRAHARTRTKHHPTKHVHNVLVFFQPLTSLWTRRPPRPRAGIIEKMVNGLVDTSRPIVGMPAGTSCLPPCAPGRQLAERS